jgi:hypothetical protein
VFSLGWEQFLKQACKQLGVCLSPVLLHITPFSGANRIGIFVRFKPECVVCLRVWLP